MKWAICLILGLLALGSLNSVETTKALELQKLLSLVDEKPASQWEEEVQAIDQAIERLTDLRHKELARADRAQNQGDRLQFSPNHLIDARRYWYEADTSREIAERCQQEINKLELRKRQLFEKHKQLDPSLKNKEKGIKHHE